MVAAGSLLLMPRLYGQAHLIDTDTPGLLIWSATALAFWNGLHEPKGRRWRVAVGVLLGLAFIEKMGAVMVLFPLLLWLIVGYLPRTFTRRRRRADWIDGFVTIGAMLVPLGLAFQQIQILQRQLPPPNVTDLFVHRPVSDCRARFWPSRSLSGACALSRLVLPEEQGLGSRAVRLSRHGPPSWPSPPLIGWLGNPAWWRETFPRLAHYYTLNVDREHSLPNIQIIYFGQIYEFSLPWHNAWVLIGDHRTRRDPGLGTIGLLWAIGQIRRDRLPFYFVVHLLTLPVIRMFPTPAHDGVRLFLPTFFFLAAFAGWGTVGPGRPLSRNRFDFPHGSRAWAWPWLVLGSAAMSLVADPSLRTLLLQRGHRRSRGGVATRL